MVSFWHFQVKPQCPLYQTLSFLYSDLYTILPFRSYVGKIIFSFYQFQGRKTTQLSQFSLRICTYTFHFLDLTLIQEVSLKSQQCQYAESSRECIYITEESSMSCSHYCGEQSGYFSMIAIPCNGKSFVLNSETVVLCLASLII